MIKEQQEYNKNLIERHEFPDGYYVQGGRFKLTWSIHFDLDEKDHAYYLYGAKCAQLSR